MLQLIALTLSVWPGPGDIRHRTRNCLFMFVNAALRENTIAFQALTCMFAISYSNEIVTSSLIL